MIPRVLDYEHRAVMDALIAALRPYVAEGEKLIYRAPFRWMLCCGDDSDDIVLPNHFEGMDLSQLCDEFGYTVRFDFRHVAIVSEHHP